MLKLRKKYEFIQLTNKRISQLKKMGCDRILRVLTNKSRQGFENV